MIVMQAMTLPGDTSIEERYRRLSLVCKRTHSELRKVALPRPLRMSNAMLESMDRIFIKIFKERVVHRGGGILKF